MLGTEKPLAWAAQMCRESRPKLTTERRPSSDTQDAMTSVSTMDNPVERLENACFFPVLNTRCVEDDKSTRSEVALPLPTFEARFASSREHEAILQLAWHVVLRTYTGSDHPSFYYESSGSTANRPSELQAGHICSIDLTEDQDTSHLLRSLDKTDTGATIATVQSVNTALHFGSTDNISTSLVSMSITASADGADLWTDRFQPRPDSCT